MRRSWRVLLIVLLGVWLTGCTDRPPQALRVGAVLWPGYEPLYLATKLGYFGDQPIQVVDYLSNTDAMLAFRNQNLEAGAFTFDEVLQLLADGIDVEVILVMDISDGGDVILANPGIDSMADLRGKRVAVESSAVGGFVLARALELHGLDLDSITVVSTNAMEQRDAFVGDRIDAAVTFDPHRTQLLKLGKQQIFSSREIPGEIVDVLVVRRDYSRAHPQVVQRLVDAWFRALEYQRAYPRISAGYSVNRFGTTVDDYLAGLELIRFASVEENRRLLDPSASPLIANADRFFEVLARMNVARRGVRIGPHLNPGYLP